MGIVQLTSSVRIVALKCAQFSLYVLTTISMGGSSQLSVDRLKVIILSQIFLPGRIFGTGVDSGIFRILDETDEANGLVWKMYFCFRVAVKMQKRLPHVKSTLRRNDWET